MDSVFFVNRAFTRPAVPSGQDRLLPYRNEGQSPHIFYTGSADVALSQTWGATTGECRTACSRLAERTTPAVLDEALG